MLCSFSTATSPGEGKTLNSTYEELLFRRICVTLIHHSSVLPFPKKCGWFYTNFHPCKKISRRGSPTVHIFNQNIRPSYVEIDIRLPSYIYIYIYIFKCMYFPKPFVKGKMWHKVYFQAEYSWFDFRLFFLLDWLLNQGISIHSAFI